MACISPKIITFTKKKLYGCTVLYCVGGKGKVGSPDET